MDPSKNLLGAEGCSSSESGWTMYIASPMQEDDDLHSYDNADDCNDQNDIDNGDNAAAADDDNGSDDSMASDASSGSQHPHKREKVQGTHGTASFKHAKVANFKHCSPATKPNKKEKGNDSTKTERSAATCRKHGK